MNFDLFFQSTEKSPINIEFEFDTHTEKFGLDNEALFQLPFICMVILTMSKGHRKPFVSHLGQLVGECLEKSIPAFKGSSQHLGWSANLRIRTVKALSFLEMAQLIVTANQNSRIQITELGKKIIQSALDGQDDLAANLLRIAREYRNIYVSSQLDMEL